MPATAIATNPTDRPRRPLSKGEKRNRKLLTEVGAIYDLTRVARTPSERSTPV